MRRPWVGWGGSPPSCRFWGPRALTSQYFRQSYHRHTCWWDRPWTGLCWPCPAVPNRVCHKHSSAVPVPQGFQKLDKFGIYSFSVGFYAAGLSQGSLMFHFVRAWLHCAPAHWIVLATIPQSPTDSAPLISPLLPALAGWTVPNVDTVVLKDRPAIDCCEAVYFGHLKMTLIRY